MAAHHPLVLAAAARDAICCAPGCAVDDLVPATIRAAFWCGLRPTDAPPTMRWLVPPLPVFDEEYIEWIDLLEAVAAARHQFVFVELGAGFGRWAVRAARLAERAGLPCLLTAVEAEPDHFRYLRQHCTDNGIDPAAHHLYWAAMSPYGGHARFHVGRPDAWYGQAVDTEAPPVSLPPATLRRLRVRALLGRPVPSTGDFLDVPALSLYEVLAPLPRVDLIDLDIQGAELHVIRRGLGILEDRVRRLHIATHSPQIEARLRAVLGGREWQLIQEYPGGTTQATPYGPITFQDGVQTWINPRAKT